MSDYFTGVRLRLYESGKGENEKVSRAYAQELSNQDHPGHHSQYPHRMKAKNTYEKVKNNHLDIGNGSAASPLFL
ncbi:hypothetical protein [Methanogenium sp. MK-MG]|uniref:hypothetical protein n=1 Tax=Methanogenium sp. MK-MG TaxID=2599926 RepID=UPI0013EA5130|nr:hypothetical protein [Methanogenium sp. MK-MG]KAF1074502.1 hypothetical protein MKMG_01936 [Methanogenium sp. MK-MG]